MIGLPPVTWAMRTVCWILVCNAQHPYNYFVTIIIVVLPMEWFATISHTSLFPSSGHRNLVSGSVNQRSNSKDQTFDDRLPITTSPHRTAKRQLDIIYTFTTAEVRV